jgi:AcrR family transcriptional regulator
VTDVNKQRAPGVHLPLITAVIVVTHFCWNVQTRWKDTMPTSKKSKKPTEEAPDRKIEILNTAASLFAEQGYKATTVDQIADRLKVNKATIYWYYSSKADILYEIVTRMVQDSDLISRSALVRSSALEAIEEIMHGLVEFSRRDINTFRVYFQELVYLEQNLSEEQYGIIRKSERRTMRTIYELLQRGVHAGEIAPCDIKYVGRLTIGLALAPYRWREPTIDVERVMDAIRFICFSGIRAKAE